MPGSLGNVDWSARQNAILIVEMANQYRKQGMSIFDAAVRGSVSRLRPILMTSFAFICGLIPLVMASGAGALGNRSIGTAAPEVCLSVHS